MYKKKVTLIIVTFVLILSTLACRLPFVGRAVNAAEDTVQKPADDSLSQSTEDPVQETMEVDVPATEESMTEAVSGNGTGTAVYSDNGVEITLPSSYMVGDVDKDLAILVEGLKVMSEEDADDIQGLYDKNKDDIILWGYDTDSPPSHQTSVLIMKNEEFAGMSLAVISAFANIMLGEEVDSISQEQTKLGGRDVLRFQTTSENAGVQTAQAIYLFNDSGKLWLVGFFTNQEQFDSRLPSFDAAVVSFTVVSVE
jgi:hypothetical protein